MKVSPFLIMTAFHFFKCGINSSHSGHIHVFNTNNILKKILQLS